MQIRFNASLDSGEAQWSKATLRDLAELPPLLRADLLKDVMEFATGAYEKAMKDLRAHWNAQRAAKGLPLDPEPSADRQYIGIQPLDDGSLSIGPLDWLDRADPHLAREFIAEAVDALNAIGARFGSETMQ